VPRRRHRRAAGSGNQIVVRHDDGGDDAPPGATWSLATYPQRDPRLTPAPEDRSYVETTEHLYWTIDGAPAFIPGQDHPLDQEPFLCTLDELRVLREPSPEQLRRMR
jgi:hypothetical protein